ncbi:MAG: exodeoxyribonuclease III, partial [Burkholderiales bacterium]
MFRLVSLNLNGIRSAATKGFEAWAQSVAADCMGVQEIKAQADTVVGRFDTLGAMKGHFHYADKRGYSGVGLYSRKTPSAVVTGIGNPEFDAEGRYVEARFDNTKRKLSIISCYFPSGSSGEERQLAKFRFLALMAPRLKALAAERELILVGDINIAHKEIDLKNWRGNQKNSGFLPEERAWMTHLLEEIGLVDVFRMLNPHPEQYTWWSNRGQAWAKNVGWRLDYHLATPGIAK